MKIAAIWMSVSLAVSALYTGDPGVERLWETEQIQAGMEAGGQETEETQPPQAPEEGQAQVRVVTREQWEDQDQSSAVGQTWEQTAAEDQVQQAAVGEGSLETATPAGPEIQAPSAVLMEASTGQVIYEKNADKQRRPASITKIMTLILIFDAIDSGKIKMTDEVVTSAHAKSMGGSQVFLEGTVIIGLNQKTFMGYRLSPIFLP